MPHYDDKEDDSLLAAHCNVALWVPALSSSSRVLWADNDLTHDQIETRLQSYIHLSRNKPQQIQLYSDNSRNKRLT